jgi:TIR domain
MDEKTCSVFVSHAASDEEIARYLKDCLEKAFPNHGVFVSSDPEDLKLGDEWVSKILRALEGAQVVLVLATERGLSRRWVWFESGRTWFSGVPMFPCCLGRLRKSGLVPPFSLRIGANIDEPRDVKMLFEQLQEFIGELKGVPDYEEIARTLIRLDVRTEEQARALADPFATDIANDIERTMKTLAPPERETIRQFVMLGSLSTNAAFQKVKATGVSMDKWSVPDHLIRLTGWLTPNSGNTPYDDMRQNTYTINQEIRPYLRAYFSKEK